MARTSPPNCCRNLVLALGDQLHTGSAAFDRFQRQRDVVWMAEVAEESTHVWTYKARIAMFLAIMRHFRDSLLKRKINIHYHSSTMQLKNLDRREPDEIKSIQEQAARLRAALCSDQAEIGR